MAPHVEWTEKAEADLDEIWIYSERHWGEAQADLYVSAIHTDVRSDEVRKLAARPIDHVLPGLWRMRCVRHFVYFRYVGVNIQVLRVLHDMMDETLYIP